MDDQNKNLILATVLSLLVIIVWTVVAPPPTPPQDTTEVAQDAGTGGDVPATLPSSTDDVEVANTTENADSAADAPRVTIQTPQLEGSISLVGGRIDELYLKDYRVTNDPEAEIVKMLSPAGGQDAYYTLYGWAPGAGLTGEDVPGPNTIWTLASGADLTPDTPIILEWTSPTGLAFSREISVDAQYMFTVTQSLSNTSSDTITAAPYGILARHGQPTDLKNFFILHEGAIQMADGELQETNWDDFTPSSELEDVSVTQGGWAGFTDHYWMSVLIPSNDGAFKISTFHDTRRDIYQTTAKLPTVQIATGDSYSATTQLFAGAKEWEQIRAYERTGVKGFIDSIDWGWFFFLTKPIFWLLHEINKLIGNMGWAIIGLTFVLKMVLLPLAFKSYVSMAKMKELQPQMEALKEAAGDDRQKLQQGMMELYKKEKVNPAAGCLPILLQIPIFFSLYKVIFVTIELRHAPWFGPFQDLSAPDPTSLVNIFGLLPFDGPAPESLLSFILIGILPLLLGISMWLQQKLNPAPTDPTQQMIFAWMPWVFMFMLGGFASGLVVYWITNNVITFAQQYMIMRSQGYTPDVFGNIRAGFSKKTGSEATDKPGDKPGKK